MTAEMKSAFPEPEHDHRRCIELALAEAARLCRTRGARLTPIRRRVLELVWANHKPVGAYEILGALRNYHASAAPPTVYRALEFLLQQGFVHRIESLNAFVGCPHPSDLHAGQFLICVDCGAVAELDARALAASISRQASRIGFEVSQTTLEVAGHCQYCKNASSARKAGQ
jgi:Fur family zinc uptake transcriptional regulator